MRMFKLKEKELTEKCKWLLWQRGIRTNTREKKFQERKK